MMQCKKCKAKVTVEQLESVDEVGYWEQGDHAGECGCGPTAKEQEDNPDLYSNTCMCEFEEEVREQL